MQRGTARQQDLQRWRFATFQPRSQQILGCVVGLDLGRNSPSQPWLIKISTKAMKQTSNFNGTLVVWIGALGRGSPMFNDPFHKIYPKTPKDPGPKP